MCFCLFEVLFWNIQILSYRKNKYGCLPDSPIFQFPDHLRSFSVYQIKNLFELNEETLQINKLEHHQAKKREAIMVAVGGELMN